MVPPDTPKRKRNRKRSKKRSSASRTRAPSHPGEGPSNSKHRSRSASIPAGRSLEAVAGPSSQQQQQEAAKSQAAPLPQTAQAHSNGKASDPMNSVTGGQPKPSSQTPPQVESPKVKASPKKKSGKQKNKPKNSSSVQGTPQQPVNEIANDLPNVSSAPEKVLVKDTGGSSQSQPNVPPASEHIDSSSNLLTLEVSPKAVNLTTMDKNYISPSHNNLSPEAHIKNCPILREQAGKKGKTLDPIKNKDEMNAVSSGGSNLDKLCLLLENMVVEHVDKDNVDCKNVKIPAQSVTKVVKTPVKKVSPSKTPPVTSSPAHQEQVGEKNREELERERKARKEEKKSKKKGKGTEEGSKKDNAVAPKVSNVDAGNVKPAPAPSVQPDGKAASTTATKGSNQEAAAGGKSKAELRKERREKQEAERQAKVAAKAQQEAEKKQKGGKGKAEGKPSLGEKGKKTSAEQGRQRRRKASGVGHGGRRVPLLGHLTPYCAQPPQEPVNSDTIHPAVRTLGLKMKEHVVDGATARMMAMLAALKRLISDYRTPESCDLSRDLADKLVPNVAYLNACRPQAIAMDNAIRWLKHTIRDVKPSVPEAQAKDHLLGAIDNYIQENVVLANHAIATHTAALLTSHDLILTFGYSALVYDLVKKVVEAGQEVGVVVVDSPQPASGAAMVTRLAQLGIPTYYRLITDVTHIMHKVTKVVVEAEAVMMNGAVQGVCGVAGLALAAAAHDKPFIVLCQTYKFCNNDLTDSLVCNELGDAESVVSCPSKQYRGLLADWQEKQNLNVVRLVYDVTPASLVRVLVTEHSVLPTSAVPVIIRRNYADILGQD